MSAHRLRERDRNIKVNLYSLHKSAMDEIGSELRSLNQLARLDLGLKIEQKVLVCSQEEERLGQNEDRGGR